MSLFERGQQGTAGPPGKSNRLFYSGSGAPDTALGKPGDHYVDKVALDLYGPKVGTDWGTPVSLIGLSDTDPIASATGGTINDVTTLVSGTKARGIRFSAGPTVTGLANGTPGRLFPIAAVGAPVTLKHQNTGSSTANRFDFETGADFVIHDGSVALVWYDNTSSRWRLGQITNDGAPITNASTGTLNDVASSTNGVTASAVLFSGVAPTVNGFAGGVTGRRLVVEAVGGPLVLAHEQAGSTAANRIKTSTAASVIVPQDAAALLVYDATASRWRIVGIGAFGTIAAGTNGYVYRSVSGAAVWSLDDLPTGANASTGTLNDVATIDGSSNPYGAVRFSGAAPVVTGLATGTDQRRLVVEATGGPLVLQNENAGSAAANRIVTGTDGDITIQNGNVAVLIYDPTSTRWRVDWTPVGLPLANSGTGALNDIVSTTATLAIPVVAIRFSGVAPQANGFASGTSGRVLIVEATGGPLILSHENASSAAGNRIKTSTAADVTIAQDACATLIYDATTSRWRLAGVGIVPSGSSFTAGGDLTGTSSSQTVAKVNGATVPVSGALTAGNVLKVSAVAALIYGAVNLAGGTNHVTGTLPLGVGGTNLTAVPGSSGQLIYNNGGAYSATANITYDGTGEAINSSGYSAYGATPATAGYARSSNNTQRKARNAANSANTTIEHYDGSDILWIGSTNTGTEQASVIRACASGNFDAVIGGSIKFSVGSANVTSVVPIYGSSSPYGVHGAVSVTTAGGKTLLAVEYSRQCITFDGTATGTMVFPAPADDDHAYVKDIIVTHTNITLSIGSGTTVLFSAVGQGRYLFRSTGVFAIAT